MSSENPSQKTQVCPTCGTRLSENATRCLVCGTELTGKAKPEEQKAAKKAEQSVQASRMPEITLGLPAALGLIAIVLLIGAAVVYFGLQATGVELELTPTPTATETALPSPTATETPTQTPIPTPTELPPFDYTVQANEYCSTLALTFGVSVQSIIILNNLPSSCPLSQGQTIKIPYPTATPAPLPTSTLSGAVATEDACEKVPITVQENDTLSSIALNYAVSMEAIKEYNGLSTDNVFLGQTLLIPLCERATPVGAATRTPTLPPPYTAPNLLLPADGGAFTLANDVVTLQWSSVGTLRENETYRVIVEDITEGEARRLTDYVTDTKYIVPTTFRPKDNVAHVIRWWVTTVRQTSTDEQGQPIYSSAGADSQKWVFTWVGSAPQGTPEP